MQFNCTLKQYILVTNREHIYKNKAADLMTCPGQAA